MSIDLDLRVAIRHPDLGKLVEAVVGADEHDEPDWIEWKSGLNLGTKQGCFPIAKNILGMVNRMPLPAAVTCEGLGYIVVGAEPGNLAGVVSVDPAELDQMLEPWLGGVEGPRYAPTYVVVEGKKVLVVTVEAPKNGDPIYTLRKAFEGGARDGDVYVRKHGRTERANSSDMKALQERSAAVRTAMPDLEVSLVGAIPLSWFDGASVERVVAQWVADRERSMESTARAEERRRHPEMTPLPKRRELVTANAVIADFARQQEQLTRSLRDVARFVSTSGLGDEPDKRTLTEYLEEVRRWAEHATLAAPAVLAARYLEAGHGLVAVRVHNPSGRYLAKVMVEVHFEWELLASADTECDEEHLPAEPRRYGESTPSPLARGLGIDRLAYPSMIPSMGRATPPRSWVEDGSVKIVFNVGDLRQEDADTSDEHILILPERPPGGVLHGRWKATVPEVHGVMRGTLDVAVREDPVNLRDLLDDEPASGDEQDS